jgi:very-short-patch-repair endonuclease
VRPGWGVDLGAQDAADGTGLRRDELLVARAAAFTAQATTPHWFSHATAAVAWGCWTYRLPDVVDVTQLTNPHVIKRDGRHVHAVRRHWTELPAEHRSRAHDLPVTSLERTVLDCARTLPGPGALVVADSAVRRGADAEVIAAMLVSAAGRRGVRQARQVLSLADARSESPGESVVRWILATSGLPRPEPQVVVTTWRAAYRVDLGWPERRVAVEFDGAVKYEDDGARGGGIDAFMSEKRRHDALVEAGWTLLRVTWPDLSDPDTLVERVRCALNRAPRDRGFCPG